MWNVTSFMADKVWNFLGNAAKWVSWWLCIFLRWTARKRRSIFLGGCDLQRNYGMVVILLSFLCNYDNLTLKLHQGKRCYPVEACLIIGRFKVRSVPRTSVALETFCLSTPAQSIPESSPLKKRPTKSIPREKGLDFQPPWCVLVIWVTPRKILNCWCSPVDFSGFDISPVILLRQSLVPG